MSDLDTSPSIPGSADVAEDLSPTQVSGEGMKATPGTKQVGATEDEADDPSLDAILAEELDAMDGGDEAAKARARDDKGRFAKDANGNPVDPAKAADPAVVDPAKKADAAEVDAKAFEAFAKPLQDKLAKLAPEHKAAVLETHKAMESFFEQEISSRESVIAKADAYYEQSAPLMKAIGETGDYLERRASDLGKSPGEIIRNVLIAEGTLAYGPLESREDAFYKMAKSYGLLHMIAGEGQQQQQQQPDPFADPAEQRQRQYDPALVRKMRDLEYKLQEREYKLQRYEQQQSQYQSQQQQRQVSSAWSNFAGAKGQNGEPLHPFAEDVKFAMNEALASGRARDIREAYAVASRPFQQRLEQLATQKAQAEAKRMQESVAKAKKAAPVKVSGMSRTGARLETLDQILESVIN